MPDRRDPWTAFADRQPEPRSRNAAGETTWFNWTQYPDHGPGPELLGAPGTVLDLGCGGGRNTAHMAVRGARAVGVDLSPILLAQARERWGHVPGVSFVPQEAVGFLKETDMRFDAIYSAYGAVWFTDPDVLLPLLRTRLAPHGCLVFSHEPPIEGCYGAQGTYIRRKNGGPPVPVVRWAHTPEQWREILARHGFVTVDTEIVEAPDPAYVPTMLVRAAPSPI
ncbi:class I SAM-dependent methyltransferase [Streptomyces scopuliridis]|uniref:Class I SAM-dependent methyltransferase n=1 Tax=Streptomyces scopuliridis TaxID=452529 RepID=A0ACD4ZV58_9ACTN|nr:class I SAM-dependent methyltransferase [Streptomyces scopuliridis]WSC02345.1 class I SAM-dependent methyltransferase [Streptomyces scopuliridis]WSC04118.1 class I SAM-dependent methyltransferase [Streptomyces scopuliridis]